MKAKISLPFGKKNRFSFHPNHETTMNFGTFFPCYQREMCPNESIQVETSFFARVAPMLVPTFGDVRVNFRSFFVPYSFCWHYFNDFITGKPSPNPQNISGFVNYDKTPFFTERDIIDLFVNESGGFATYTQEDDYDFVAEIHISQTAVEYNRYSFTKKGKDLLRIFQSLGYNFSFCQYKNALNQDYTIRFDALPFIAFCGVYYEFFVPQQFKQVNYWLNFQQYLHNALPSSDGINLTASQLFGLIDSMVLAYKKDYFTGAWSEPNSIAEDYFTNMELVVNPVEGGNTSVDTGLNVGVYTDTGSEAPSEAVPDASFPSWGLSLAEKVVSLLTQYNLVGSDWANRILSQFGIKPVERLGVPQYCGDWSTQLTIDSVFDTAGAAENPLGSYAGRGIMAGKSRTFECSTKEYGIFMIIASVEPVVSYTDGVDRHLLNKTRFDFFTPKFDGLGMQAIAKCELFNTIYDGGSDNQARLKALQMYKDAAFAFQPRYAHLKYSKNRVTGDFNVKTVAEDVAPYSLQRNLFNDKFASGSALKFNGISSLTLQNIIYQWDALQYNRLFAETDGLSDPFFCLFDFNVTLISPMLPISESFEQYESKSNGIEVEKDGAFSN